MPRLKQINSTLLFLIPPQGVGPVPGRKSADQTQNRQQSVSHLTVQALMDLAVSTQANVSLITGVALSMSRHHHHLARFLSHVSPQGFKFCLLPHIHCAHLPLLFLTDESWNAPQAISHPPRVTQWGSSRNGAQPSEKSGTVPCTQAPAPWHDHRI